MRYTCPHQYRPKGQCACRKPGLKLLEDAQAEFPIDMEKSWFVGDRLRDIETGAHAHLKTVLVATGGFSSDDEFFRIPSRMFLWAICQMRSTRCNNGE